MKNILVLLDLTEVSENVIRHAGIWAEKFDAKCWLVHVAAPDPEFVGYEVGPKYIRDDRSKVLRDEHRELSELKNKLKNTGVDCEALLIQGYVNECILGEVEKIKN